MFGYFGRGASAHTLFETNTRGISSLLVLLLWPSTFPALGLLNLRALNLQLKEGKL